TNSTVRLGIALLILVVLALGLWSSRPFFKVSRADIAGNLDWPAYGNDLANTRFQDVDQINPSNVKNLQVEWVFHTGVTDEATELEVSPVVINGRMFITDGHSNVFALDAATGRQIWAYKPIEIPDEMPPIGQISACCGRTNRGVAFANGMVFYGRYD